MREPSSDRSSDPRDVPGEPGRPILRVIDEGAEVAWLNLVPVRRDGSGRLVAVGLVEMPHAPDGGRWTTIRGITSPGEPTDAAVSRCIADALGEGARARRSDPPRIGAEARCGPDRRDDRGVSGDGGAVTGSIAVEVLGRLQPRGPVIRFAWFLVTALPPRGDVAPGPWALLADFLESEGERGLATRMRQS